MNNRLTKVFEGKNKKVLNIFCTAGYPHINSLPDVIMALQQNGVDMIEVGMPYSDPIADGPVIQQSNMVALQNGMTISLLFDQLHAIKEQINIPIILMGYFNPVMQYGLEKFCKVAASAGVSGIILPDLPMYEYENMYSKIFKDHGLSVIFLITPQTAEERIVQADKLSSGFLYAVSSSATTGEASDARKTEKYFKRIAAMKLKNPVLIGFGIHNKNSFDNACQYANGAIIGSAYIRALAAGQDIYAATEAFINTIK